MNDSLKINRRPPIVTIVGHVDHGKTSLLSALLKTNLTAKEAGGMTQAVSAHSLIHDGRKITFVDTPGHEAFLTMRKRGAVLADIVLLVVAAEEGVKPQTREAINQIKEGKGYPIVVLTKKDLPEANPEKVKRELSENGFLVEGLGGTIPVCETSINDEESLKKLLDLILLMSELHDFEGRSEGGLDALVLESVLDRKRGPLSLVVVRGGTLKIGEEIFCADAFGRIRTFLDSQGRAVKICDAGEACYLMGLNKAAPVGEALRRERIAKINSALLPQDPKTEEPGTGKLKVVVKADTLGSLEAILQSIGSLESLKMGAVNGLAVSFAGLGDISDNDVYTALEAGAAIVGFRVKTYPSALELANDRGVEIRTYEIIYQLLDELSQGLAGLLAWQKKTAAPSAKFIKIFVLESGDQIVGAKVENGTLKVGQNLVVKRGEEEIFKSSIKQLRIGKQRVEKVTTGLEFGLLFKDNLSPGYLKVGDVLTVI